MNKEKIMDQLMDIRELTGGADSPSIDLKRDSMVIRDISSNVIKELNSKPVMPQVFDDWYKRSVQLKKEHPDRDIDLFYGLANVYLASFDTEESWKDIAGWLRGDIDKYLMCIDAIRYGYEVEK